MAPKLENENIDLHVIQPYEKDYFFTTVNDTFGYNVYLYWMDDTLVGKSYENTMAFANAGSVICVQFAPYLNINELFLHEIPFDSERFKYKEDGSQLPISGDAKVYRIARFQNITVDSPGVINKRVGTFNAYNFEGSIGGSRSWTNESKLYNYPYRFAFLSDGLIEPIMIKYEHCPTNTNEIWVRMALNINADYSIYIRNYKQDYDGLLEQNIASTSRDLPCISSQYAQWLATSKNQMQTSLTQNTVNGLIGGALGSGAIGATIGSVVPGIGTAAGAVVGAIGGGLFSAFNSASSQNAKEKDMRNVPNNLVSRGADIILNMNTHKKTLKVIKYTQNNEYMRKIGDYFALYGYKQNKLMTPGLRDRYYYNFVKTSGCNLSSDGIPKNHLQTIKNIFDRGVTMWHIDRSGVVFGDYSKDNKEV